MSQGVKRRQGFWAGELECATRCGRMRRVNEDALKKRLGRVTGVWRVHTLYSKRRSISRLSSPDYLLARLYATKIPLLLSLGARRGLSQDVNVNN
jgi:hypothetical protein